MSNKIAPEKEGVIKTHLWNNIDNYNIELPKTDVIIHFYMPLKHNR